jgi:hypothetical protein
MWEPDPKFKYLYTPVNYNGKIYWHRKDRLKTKKFIEKITAYENRELPESFNTAKKNERAKVARFLQTGRF